MTVEDLTGLAWFIRQSLSTLLGKEFTKILSQNKKKMVRKMDIIPRTMFCMIKPYLGLRAFNRQTGQRLTAALKNMGKGNKDVCYNTLKRIIVFKDEKKKYCGVNFQ